MSSKSARVCRSRWKSNSSPTPEAGLVDAVFERLCSAASRGTAVRAATIVSTYKLPVDYRIDLAQEAFLELWRKRTAYDPSRGSERAFAERVIANRMISLMRSMHSARSGQFRETHLDSALAWPAPDDGTDLRLDVWSVLASASQFDRRVAMYMIEHSPTETSRGLRVPRAAVYRAVERLRVAFRAAGFTGSRHPYVACRRKGDREFKTCRQEARS